MFCMISWFCTKLAFCTKTRKLDLVDSTVRYEVMKPCTGSVEGIDAFIYWKSKIWSGVTDTPPLIQSRASDIYSKIMFKPNDHGCRQWGDHKGSQGQPGRPVVRSDKCHKQATALPAQKGLADKRRGEAPFGWTKNFGHYFYCFEEQWIYHSCFHWQQEWCLQ